MTISFRTMEVESMQISTVFVPVQKVPDFILNDAIKMANGMNELVRNAGECRKLNSIAKRSMFECYAAVIELMFGCDKDVAEKAVSREYCLCESLPMFPEKGTEDPRWFQTKAYWIQVVDNAIDYLNTFKAISNGTYKPEQHTSVDSASEILKICYDFLNGN